MKKIEAAHILLIDAANLFISIKKENVSNATISSYNTLLKKLKSLHHMYLDEILPIDIVNLCNKNNISSGVCMKLIRFVRSIHNYISFYLSAFSEGLKIPKHEKTVKHFKYLEQNELKNFFESIKKANPTFIRYVLFLHFSLLRTNEALSIENNFIDMSKRIITIPSYIMKNKKRDFSLPITSHIEKLLIFGNNYLFAKEKSKDKKYSKSFFLKN